MNVLEDLKDLMEEIKTDTVSEQIDIICRFRAFLIGVMTGRPPLLAQDIGEDDRWCSEYRGLFIHFGRDKSKFLAWCGKLAELLSTDPSVTEINNFYTKSGLPVIPEYISLEPVMPGKLLI